MTGLARRMIVWGPCLFGAVVGGVVDYLNGFWGPGVASGAVLGFLVGQRRRAKLQDARLQDARLQDD